MGEAEAEALNRRGLGDVLLQVLVDELLECQLAAVTDEGAE
jgi:hypothetical protein